MSQDCCIGPMEMKITVPLALFSPIILPDVVNDDLVQHYIQPKFLPWERWATEREFGKSKSLSCLLGSKSLIQTKPGYGFHMCVNDSSRHIIATAMKAFFRILPNTLPSVRAYRSSDSLIGSLKQPNFTLIFLWISFTLKLILAHAFLSFKLTS